MNYEKCPQINFEEKNKFLSEEESKEIAKNFLNKYNINLLDYGY
jgi:hypothetical protein